MFEYFIVAMGGALGASARFLIGSILPATILSSFPIRIITVNIIGCFLMGFIIEILTAHYPTNINLKLFLTTGFLGGFTTFSSFALEFGTLTENNMVNIALAYAALSVFIGVIAFFIGAKIAKLI